MTERSRYDMPGDDTDMLEIEHYAPRKPNPPRPVPVPERTVPTHATAPLDAPDQLTRAAPARSAAPAPQPVPHPAPAIPSPAPAARATPPPPPPRLPGPAVRPSRPRESLAPVAIALFALAGTLMTGLLLFVGLRLVTTARDQTPIAGLMPTEAVTATPTLALPTFMAATPTLGVEIVPWDGRERFTLLLLGLDKRPFQTGTAFRTDSMILISLDPATRSIGMLSIPRDLYIEIPPDTVVGNSYGLQRVNTAYFLGEQVRPGYGPRLAMQTVQYNLGIRVHDYVVYDFEAVIAAIDAVGGVEIDVPRDIVDRQYPDLHTFGYDPLYIRAGRQLMDGAMALKYARTRHDSSDIDRARRQQQVITAVRDRILNLNLLPELLVRAPGLWAQLSRHVQSGLSLDQILRLAVYAADIPAQNIRQGVIDYRYVQSINWNGAAVLVPNRASIGPLLVEVFGPDYNR